MKKRISIGLILMLYAASLAGCAANGSDASRESDPAQDPARRHRKRKLNRNSLRRRKPGSRKFRRTGRRRSLRKTYRWFT